MIILLASCGDANDDGGAGELRAQSLLDELLDEELELERGIGLQERREDPVAGGGDAGGIARRGARAAGKLALADSAGADERLERLGVDRLELAVAADRVG